MSLVFHACEHTIAFITLGKTNKYGPKIEKITLLQVLFIFMIGYTF